MLVQIYNYRYTSNSNSDNNIDSYNDSYNNTTKVAHNSTSGADRKVTFLSDGGKVVRYSDGTEKEVDSEGVVTVTFTNGDVKKVTNLGTLAMRRPWRCSLYTVV